MIFVGAAFGRLVSFALRSGAEIEPIVKQLKGISCHATAWDQGGRIRSCADAIAKAMEKALENEEIESSQTEPPAETQPEKGPLKGACPECGGIISHEGGCMVCRTCGFSECG